MDQKNDTVKTAFGLVNRRALEKLRNSFDTTRLFKVCKTVDNLRGHEDRLYDLRVKILTLHGMAHELINDAGISVLKQQSIWEFALEIEDELSDFSAMAEDFSDAAACVRELVALSPEDD